MSEVSKIMKGTSQKCDIDRTNAPATRPVRNEFLERLKQISDDDIEKLREHVRIQKGLTTLEKAKKKLNYRAPPNVAPRSNIATELRTRMRLRWVQVNFKSLMNKYSLKDDDLDDELYLKLRKEAMSRPCGELHAEEEDQKNENLKKLSAMAKHNDEPEYKINKNFDYRIRAIKSIPIITEEFKKFYQDYRKSPFILSSKLVEPRICQMPAIDEEKEIWLYPFTKDDSVPLHRLQKDSPVDNRNAREKARPPLKPGRRVVRKRSIKGTKPPWHYALSCGDLVF